VGGNLKAACETGTLRFRFDQTLSNFAKLENELKNKFSPCEIRLPGVSIILFAHAAALPISGGANG